MWYITSMRTSIVVTIIAALVFGVGVYGLLKITKGDSYQALTNTNQNPGAVTQVSINNKTFTVELAITADQQARGLSGRDEIPANQGMLFVFKPAQKTSFWMKDMKFPLDIVWIHNQKIVDISRNLPPPSTDTSTKDLPTYSPSEAVDYVLEINAGQATYFQVGDRVTINDSVST